MSAPAAGYQPMHLGVHELILTGWDTEPAWTVGGTLGGVLGAVTALQALSTTPYGSVTVYDPFASGEPLETLFVDVETLMADFIALAPATEYASYIALANAAVDSIFDSATIDAAVSNFSDNQIDAAIGEIGVLNLLLSDLESVNSSARINGAIALLAGANKNTAEYRKQLELKMYSDKFAATLQATDNIMRSRLQNQAHVVQIQQMVLATAQLHIEAARLQYNDELQNTLGDVFWDIKAWDFAYSALGSLGGISTIPAQANPFSTFASSVAALSPLIISAYKAFT